MSNPKSFIEIRSQDQVVQKLQTQIEKSLLLNMWVGKAVALLKRYSQTLDELDQESDSVRRGLKIESCESYFMSAIILFHRCFVDQPTMHLSIEQVTDDQEMREIYRQILDLRNDEFIHWKGIRSKIDVTYSFEATTPTQVLFAEQIQGNYSDTIGPGLDVKPFLKLFQTTGDYVESRRLAILEKLRKRIAEPDVFRSTQFLNASGESIIKKSNG